MTGTRTEYTVIATRWAKGWELGVQGVGATQSHTLDDAPMMARDLIARRMDVPADSFDVVVKPQLGGKPLSGSAARELSSVERILARRRSFKARLARLSELARSAGDHTHTHSRSGR